jgi:hypothetical protein
VDDGAVLADVKRKLKREDPEHEAELFDALQRIWFAGGREATLAWMAAKKMGSVADAFSAWVDANPAAAKALLDASKREGAAA